MPTSTVNGGEMTEHRGLCARDRYSKTQTEDLGEANAGAVSTIQEPKEQGEPPEALEQGSNLGDIGTAYAKDNLENTDTDDIPVVPTFHRKGKLSYVSYNKPLVGPK
ncbi:hypothetical protein U1Q18_002124, partial [Sarracenia purpurea var. burkii]